MSRWNVSFLLLLATTYCGVSEAKPSPETAGVLSLVPGLGQVSNGNHLEGLGWFVTSVGLYFSGNTHLSNIGYKIWSYNMYDAYKDGGGAETAKYNAFQNYISIFNPLNVVDPFTVPMLGFSAYSATSTNGANKAKLGPNNPLYGAIYFGFVGWGEEGLFRGFLYPSFSKAFHSHITGAVVSSAIFSASHLTNKNSFYHSGRGLSLLFLYGMIWCAQASYNNYDLRHNIFSHAWFDFMIEYAGEQASGNAVPPLGARVTIPLP